MKETSRFLHRLDNKTNAAESLGEIAGRDSADPTRNGFAERQLANRQALG